MYYIGIDLGGTNIKAGIIDDTGKILAQGSVKTNAKRPYREIIEDMAHLAIKLAGDKKLDLKTDIGGIGVGSPGSIDSEKGIITYSNNLDWHDVHVIEELKKYLPDTPVYIANDANVAALGEAMFGAGREYGDSVLITLGTGVGGGIVIWDKMFEGNRSAGAEIGHMVIEVGGKPCTCGRRGCFEAYSSATALIRDTREAMRRHTSSAMWQYAGDLDRVDGTTAFECAKKGDPAAQAVVDNYIMYLGEGIVNIANVLRPEVIMLGGGVSAQGDNLVKPLQRYIDANAYGGKKGPRVLIMIAKLGNDAGIVGAACLAKKHIEEKVK